MAVIYDYLLGKLKVCPVYDFSEDIAELREDVSELAGGEAALDTRVTALETAIAPDVTLLVQQIAFFHGEGALDLGHIVCGDFAQSEFFPLDWKFGEWGHDGLILTFNNWAV